MSSYFQAEAVDMLIGVYIENRAGKVVTHKVCFRSSYVSAVVFFAINQVYVRAVVCMVITRCK